MKVFLSQGVKFEGDNFPYSWSKAYNSSMIPRKGDFVEDPLWKDPGEYEVKSVRFNYFEDVCYVTLDEYVHILPKTRGTEFEHIAEGHGWKANWGKLNA